MTYTVLILRRAQRALQRRPQEDSERVREAMRGLAPNPRPTGGLPLTGRAGWRIREGDDRGSDDLDEGPHTVTLVQVGHRRDV
jgi:mRNA interferase RelE/StbE